jgi:DNA-binding CsgD family transcriptional regulator
MGRARPELIDSFEFANESISWISGYENEAAVDDASRQIVRYFGLEAFVFGALFRSGEREHYRYLVGCKPEWCFLYNQSKWYAIDPFIEYALHHTSPVLASDVPLTSPGQQRMMAAAAEHGFRSGVVVPAHSDSSVRVGVLYLGTDQGSALAYRSFVRHRSLMRAFAMELLEWWDARLRQTSMTDLELDELDLELLHMAQDHATSEEAARELGVTLARVEDRYKRLDQKLNAPRKRYAVEKAVALGLIKPKS